MIDNKKPKQKSKAASKTLISKAKVLVVDDNVDLLKLISIRLKPMEFDIKTATSAEEAISILSLWRADLVISDLQMPGMSGMELFEYIHAKDPLLPVIILTAHGTIPEAVEATQAGVASYLTKPFDSEALLEQISSALEARSFSGNSNGSANNQSDAQWRRRIFSKSTIMETLLQQVETLAAGKALVSIEGEPGAGKDEIARALHARSERATKPLVHLASTSIPSEDLDTEMFGLVADPLTGQSEKEGLLRQAVGGTLLISDFNEISAPFIQKVLSAILAEEACPINSDKKYKVDVRPVITAESAESHIRASAGIWELSSKLDFACIVVPPLRERREDIPLLIQHILHSQGTEVEMQFSNKAMQQILASEWPGNVRHLINVVKQCMRLSKTKIISERLVNSRIGNAIHQVQPLSNAHREFERAYLTETLKVTNGNVTRAANLAKRNRTEFHRLLKKHKIEAKSFRQ